MMLQMATPKYLFRQPVIKAAHVGQFKRERLLSESVRDRYGNGTAIGAAKMGDGN